MAEQEQPERTEEQLKALKRQVSGIPASLYTEAPKKAEGETEQPTTTDRSAEAHREPKAATSKSKLLVRRSPKRKK